MLLCASIFTFSSSAHAGELYVNVVDSFGYPLENVSVVITPVDLSEDQKKARRNKPFLIRRTDRLGRFLFVRVQPGKHVLTAKHRAGSSSRICYLVADIQIDYTENVESHSVEITLQSVRRYKVSGRVLGLGELTGQQLVIFFEPRAYPSEAKPPSPGWPSSSTVMGDSKYTFLAEDTNCAWVPLIEECSKRLPARLARSTFPKIKKDCYSTASRRWPIRPHHLEPRAPSRARKQAVCSKSIDLRATTSPRRRGSPPPCPQQLWPQPESASHNPDDSGCDSQTREIGNVVARKAPATFWPRILFPAFHDVDVAHHDQGWTPSPGSVTIANVDRSPIEIKLVNFEISFGSYLPFHHYQGPRPIAVSHDRNPDPVQLFSVGRRAPSRLRFR